MSTIIVTPHVTTGTSGETIIFAMAERTYSKTFIREWRQHRNLSLRRLADRMEGAPGETLISHASLGRIENGEQPYSQPILEALAEALNVSVSSLIGTDPTKEGQVIDLVRRLSDSDKARAIAILEAMAKAG